MPRAVLPFCLGLILASPAAAARWDPTPTFPWSYSVNGTEAATDLAMGPFDSVWVAGNVTNGFNATSGRDVLAIMFSNTQTRVAWTATITAKPISTTIYDRDGLDEGPPSIAVMPHYFGSTNVNIEQFLAFTSTRTGGVGELTTWRLQGYFTTSSSPWFENIHGNPCGAAGIAASGSGTPFSVGWTTANGVDQLFYVRQIRTSPTSTTFQPRVSATFWTGSLTLSVTGRAIAVDGPGNVWIAAQSGGDIELFKYLPEYYEDTYAVELFASPAPGWPRRFVSPEWDEPLDAARDATGALWVAGSIGGAGAVWKFDEYGNPAAGFPVRYSPGPPTVFRALTLDDSQNCYVTGSAGGNLVVTGWDRAGQVLAGFPLIVPAGADAAEGCGIGHEYGGALWIAATVTAAPGTWGGTRIALYRYVFVPDPPTIAAGQVRILGPEGAVLNLARAERMSIMAWPTGGGSVVAEIRNLRGELIRRLEDTGPGHQAVTIEWDGTNGAGQQVASGTYACIVTGGGLNVVKRVVVIRRW